MSVTADRVSHLPGVLTDRLKEPLDRAAGALSSLTDRIPRGISGTPSAAHGWDIRSIPS